MDDKTITLIVSLAGTISTLTASAIGFYFTARARTASFRQILFERQLDLITRLIRLQGRIRIYLTILAGEDKSFHDQAREDLRTCVRQFSEMEDEGAAILPTDLWVEVKKLGAHFTGLLNDYDDGKGISTDKFSDMVGSETKVALLGRATIGVDELTDESINLFSKQEDYEGLVNIKPSYFAKLHKKKNAKKDTM